MPIDSAAQPPPSRWRDLVGEGLLSATAGLCLVEMTAGLQTLLVATILPRHRRHPALRSCVQRIHARWNRFDSCEWCGRRSPWPRTAALPVLRLFPGRNRAGRSRAVHASPGRGPFDPGIRRRRDVLTGVRVPRLYPAQLRPKMLALLSGVWVVTGLLGPPFGALLASTVGWRWALAVAIPTLLLGYGVLAARVRHIPPENASTRQGLGAAVILMVGSAIFLAGFSTGGWGWVAALGGLALALPAVNQLIPPAMRRGLFGNALVLSFG